MYVTLHIWISIHHMIIFFGAQVWNDDISRCVSQFFKILIFWVVRGGGGVKGQKMAQIYKKLFLSPYLRNRASCDCVFWYTCVKWWYLQQFLFIFQNSDFSGFSNFINKYKKEILRHVPPSSHVSDFWI